MGLCQIKVRPMATPQQARSSSFSPYYRDLASELMEHTWVAVLYAVGCVIFSYLLGFFSSPSAIFIAAEIPTVCIATAVLREDERLSVRVPLVWCLTAIFSWGIEMSSTESNLYNEIAVSALVILFGYWLGRAVIGSIAEFKKDSLHESLAYIIANLASVWGATLIIARLAALIIHPILISIIEPTQVGTVLLTVLRMAQAISLWNWLPLGVFLFGIALFAAIRFQDDPYKPRTYAEVLPTKLPPVMNELAAMVRLPAWLCIVILGFVVHFVQQAWISFRDFLSVWVGRMILILLSLVFPTALITLAHFIFLWASQGISEYLSGKVESAGDRIFLIVGVHCFTLVALCLYVVAVVALALEIMPVPVKQVLGMIKSFVFQTGFPAANAVGRSFSLFGILFIAIPIGSLLPGSHGFGAFSITYAGIVFGAAIYLASKSKKVSDGAR